MSGRKARMAFLVAAAGGALALWRRLRPRPRPGPGQANVVIGLLRADGSAYPGGAQLVLSAGGQRTPLRPGPEGTFVAAVTPGSYGLAGDVDGRLRLPPRQVAAAAEARRWDVTVFSPDEPHLRLGGQVLPVTLRPDLLVVAVPGHTPTDQALRLARRARDELGLEAFDPNPDNPNQPPPTPGTPGVPATPAGELRTEAGFVVLRDRSAPTTVDPRLVDGLTRLAVDVGYDAGAVRVGFVADLGERGRPMIDDRYVVRLGSEKDDKADREPTAQARRLVESIGAEILRPLPVAGAYLIRFRDLDVRRQLDRLERLVAAGALLYGEPDLVSPADDLVDLSFYLASYQGTPSQPASDALARMGADQAWAAVVAAQRADAAGALATFDRGVVTGSPFLTGVPVELRDALGNNVGAHTIDLGLPTPYHGMSVFGVASGNGHLGVWGVAPNLRHVALQRPSPASASTLWDPLDQVRLGGVRVVSLSFKPEIGALDSYSMDRLSGFADAGLLLVVAAGNDLRRLRLIDGAMPMSDTTTGGITLKWVDFPLAAHPRVLTVASTQVGADGEEQYWDGGANLGSNRGDPVDLCALSTGIVTCADATTAAPQAGTSLAAPLVAATAALVWALRPDLTLPQVKAILCTTAKRVRPSEITFWRVPVPAPLDWDPAVPVPLHHLRYGYGQVDVAAAVAATLARP